MKGHVSAAPVEGASMTPKAASGPNLSNRTRPFVWLAAFVTAATILAFDLSLPLGVAGGVPYVALVLIGVWLQKPQYIFVLAALGSVLTVYGYFVSPTGGIFWVVLTNRALALFAIWVTAFLLFSRKRFEQALLTAHDKLETKVLGRTKSLRQEIVERKKTESALRSREEQYRILVETNPHGIQEIDTKGNIVFCNHALCQILGYSAEELRGKRVSDLVADEERTRTLENIAKYVREQPDPFSYFSKNITKDGRVIDLEINWNYKRDERGEILGFISIITDITEYKLVKEKLIDSELGKYAALGALNQIPFGIVIVDGDATIKFTNQTAREIADKKDGILFRKDKIYTGWPKQRIRLLEIIKNTVENAKTNYSLPNEVIALLRTSGGEPLSVMVCSLWDNHVRFGLEKSDEPLAVLFITAPERQLEAPAETLQNLFGLTKSEAVLTEKLVAGMTLEEISADQSITKHTARKHLKSVFEKTGSNRQAQLIKLVMSTPVWITTNTPS